MHLVGYSERGMINSLFYEIMFSYKPEKLIEELLSLIYFQDGKKNKHIVDCKVLIEQSFSDFGDADVLILYSNGFSKGTIFIEAKVKTFHRKVWTLNRQLDLFNKGIKNKKLNSSNLFSQLYFKSRLFNSLKESGIDKLRRGVKFPVCSSKRLRKIGSNKVVIDAINLMKEHTDDSFFVALVPDDINNVRQFALNRLRDFRPAGFNDWDTDSWGFITWSQIEEFCNNHNMINTLGNFEFNDGQIYKNNL